MKRFEQMTLTAPYLRVNNRQRNIDFYEQVLGLRVLHEENALAFLGGHDAKQPRLILEESPSYRTRAVVGLKKLHTLVVKVDAKDIAELLARKCPVLQVYRGEKGYAFSALSPEGDRFLLHGETDVACLEPVAYPDLAADPAFQGVADLEVVAVKLHVPNQAVSSPFYEQLPLTVELIEAQGSDLQVENDQTWDLGGFEFAVDESFDLASLNAHFQSLGAETTLNKKGRTLLVTDPSGLDWWFLK